MQFVTVNTQEENLLICMLCTFVVLQFYWGVAIFNKICYRSVGESLAVYLSQSVCTFLCEHGFFLSR